jgi:outer membrane protein assembly factor BamA
MPRFPALLLSLAIAASAQAPSTYKTAHIVFHNPGSFTQQQLETVSGMHIGSPANAETLGAAAQRLSDSGYFDDIGANLDGTADNTTVVFNLKPTPLDQMFPVTFANFVWLTQDELEAAVHAKLPLFIDYLPENSAQADVISSILTGALAAKGIADATVQHETVEPTLIRPARTMEFRVASPAPHVANIKLAGVTPALVPLVQKSVNETAKKPYDAGMAGGSTADSILSPLLDAGYLHAMLSNITVTPGEPAARTVPVVVSATLNPGDIDHVSAITFAGTPLLSADAFAATAKLRPGDVASRHELLQTLAPLDAAYRAQGYMDVIIVAAPTFDAAAHTVAYAVTVTPGEQYRVHQVTTEGLDAAAQADFDHGFTLKPGDLYNPGYITRFLTNNTALRSLAGYAGGFKAYAYPATHTVDVVVSFYRNPNSRVPR